MENSSSSSSKKCSMAHKNSIVMHMHGCSVCVCVCVCVCLFKSIYRYFCQNNIKITTFHDLIHCSVTLPISAHPLTHTLNCSTSLTLSLPLTDPHSPHNRTTPTLLTHYTAEPVMITLANCNLSSRSSQSANTS